MPKIYGSHKSGADIYKDHASKKFYIIEWNPTTRKIFKKFVAFKPLEKRKTIKSIIRKTRKLVKVIKGKQLGGQPGKIGQMPISECQTQILNTPSYRNILDSQLNLADPKQVFRDIQTIRERYTQHFAGKKLMDIIYNYPAPGQKQQLGTINQCWNHVINNPESITGGANGIHLYIAAGNDGKWQLVGIFKK